MIKVHHILKDGTKVDDVAGCVIKAEEHSVLYEVINRINEERRRKDEVI